MCDSTVTSPVESRVAASQPEKSRKGYGMVEERGNATPKVCGEFSSGDFAMPLWLRVYATIAVTTSHNSGRWRVRKH